MTNRHLLSLYAAAPLLAAPLLAAPLCAQTAYTLPAEDRPLGGTPDDLYSIGSLEGEPWEILSGVRGVGFDDAGHLYILDSDSRVLKFGPDGEFLGQFGRKGQGPGEINRPAAMAVGGDGMVVVVDPSAGYQVFGPEGEYRHTIRPETPVLSSQVVLSGEALFVAGGRPGALAAGGRGGRLPVQRQPLRPGAAAEVIHEADGPAVERSVVSAAGGQTRVMMRRPPQYSLSLKLAAGRGGEVALVSATDWRIEILSSTGGVRATLERPLRARPSTPRDREVVETRMRDGGGAAAGAIGFGGGPPAGMAVPRGEVEIAATIPAVRGLRGDGAGILFVARETNPVEQPKPPIDVVTLDGSYVGTLSGQELPAAFGPDRRAAYVETDDLGIERVVVRRLPASWFGG